MNVVKFTGGLGNQMFYYVLYRRFQKLNGNSSVVANLDFYSKASIDFELLDVFFNTNQLLNIDKSGIEKKYRKLNKFGDVVFRGHVPYLDKLVYGEKEAYVYDENVFALRNSLLDGYWQSYRYLEGIEDEIRNELSFSLNDSGLKEFARKIRENGKDVVSVHVRRGDYISLSKIYGGICTEEYYQKAIEFFTEKHDKLTFVFFSNDIEWVKKNMSSEDYECIFVEESMFDDYKDWYDMYLMSICKHNIIANSTFSWWGAWLNDNKDKVVYAPKTWVHTYSAPDICPPNWIRA